MCVRDHVWLDSAPDIINVRLYVCGADTDDVWRHERTLVRLGFFWAAWEEVLKTGPVPSEMFDDNDALRCSWLSSSVIDWSWSVCVIGHTWFRWSKLQACLTTERLDQTCHVFELRGKLKKNSKSWHVDHQNILASAKLTYLGLWVYYWSRCFWLFDYIFAVTCSSCFASLMLQIIYI